MNSQLNTADRSAVLVIDLQRKYTTPSSALVLDHADELVGRVADFVDASRGLGAKVVWINRRSRPQVGPGRRTTKLFGDKLASFQNNDMDPQDERLLPAESDIQIIKPRHSAFYETDLESCLRNWNIEGVVLAGVTTNVCVTATAFDAVARDLDVVIAGDLTASLPIMRSPEHVMTADEVQGATLASLQYSVGEVRSHRAILDFWESSSVPDSAT